MPPSADYRPTRFTALTSFCDGIYLENIIRLLPVVYVANGCVLSKMATQQRRSKYDVSVKTLYFKVVTSELRKVKFLFIFIFIHLNGSMQQENKTKT